MSEQRVCRTCKHSGPFDAGAFCIAPVSVIGNHGITAEVPCGHRCQPEVGDAPAEPHITTRCGVCGEQDLHDPSCHYKGSVKAVERVIDDDAAPQSEAQHEPPAGRIYVPANLDLRARVSDTDIEYTLAQGWQSIDSAPKDGALMHAVCEARTSDSNIEYPAAAPIRKALAQCESYLVELDEDGYNLRKSDWEELCDAINKV